jgi:hypothetical protein
MNMSGREARAPGRDGVYDTGLFEYNREDMTVEAMQSRMSSWTSGDLFAVFRDDLGGTHAQYSRFEDFADVALTQLVRSRRGFENVSVDRETLLFLVSILMISRMHGYTFDDFVELRDHQGKQLFDFRGLCEWIAMNEELFMTEAEIVAEMDDESIESLHAEYDQMPVAV